MTKIPPPFFIKARVRVECSGGKIKVTLTAFHRRVCPSLCRAMSVHGDKLANMSIMRVNASVFYYLAEVL